MKEEEKGIDCCFPTVEVVAIYPNPNKQKNRIKEAGTCHISVKDLGVDIKNIVYLVNNDGAIHIHGPARVYKKESSSPDNQKEEKVLVPTLSFHNQAIWKHIQDVIRNTLKIRSQTVEN
ncbi:MAG: hypothetical protein KDK96_10755 [Chlamydiia bacterium]|nr:hypothetical protein [Chlamydiia bacterium]